MTIYNAQGRPFSKWRPTEKFEWELSHRHSWACEELVREFRFDPTRRWRFDYAWPTEKVAVEIDGTLGRHSTPSGQAGDNEKLNRALELGWRVYRFNTTQLGSKEKVEAAVDQVCYHLCERTNESSNLG